MLYLKTGVRIFAVAAGALASVALATTASAGLIFDRGLPTANLNNVSGANRSNVAWADGGSTVLMGDNFSLAYADVINEIRVWVASRDPVPPANAYKLYLGTDIGVGTVVNFVESSSSVSLTTYSGGATYQATNGDMINLFEVDFSGLNLALGAGTYAFGIGGLVSSTCAVCNTPFVHASNAALSGSPQMGADDLIYGFNSLGALDVANGYPFNSFNNGWDKSSDINVQVFAPEPSSVALIAVALLSLLGLGLMRRRRNT